MDAFSIWLSPILQVSARGLLSRLDKIKIGRLRLRSCSLPCRSRPSLEQSTACGPSPYVSFIAGGYNTLRVREDVCIIARSVSHLFHNDVPIISLSHSKNSARLEVTPRSPSEPGDSFFESIVLRSTLYPTTWHSLYSAFSTSSLIAFS
jgi:hypothetical protein